MPWEKTFNIEVAVDQAIEVFWDKGFHRASLADLLKAIGINKGSFYDAKLRRARLDSLKAMNNPEAALNKLFDIMIDDSVTNEKKSGCFLVNTALNLSSMPAEVVSIIKLGFSEFEVFFEEQLRLGIERQQFRADLNVSSQAKALFTTICGLRLLARGVYGREDFDAIKDQALRPLLNQSV